MAEHLDDIEDAYWSARVNQVLAKDEPTAPVAPEPPETRFARLLGLVLNGLFDG